MCQKWVKDLINTVVPLGTIVMWHLNIAVRAGWTTATATCRTRAS